MDYNTRLGDIGTGLSGGQKRRILLARALYNNPKILVLDEATSLLDTLNERLVNSAIKAYSVDAHHIVAHRSETIAMAQRVVARLGRAMSSATLRNPALRRRCWPRRISSEES